MYCLNADVGSADHELEEYVEMKWTAVNAEESFVDVQFNALSIMPLKRFFFNISSNTLYTSLDIYLWC